MTMEKKNGVTEVQTLTALVEFARANGFEDTAILAKGDHMVEVRSRKRDRKADTSKRDANIALGEQFAANFTGETFKAADVAAALGVSTAKACAVIRAMEWAGVPTTDKTKTYTLG